MSLRIFFTIALAAFICTIFGCGSGGSRDGSGNSGTVSSNDNIPTPIGAGKYHSVALKSDGTVWTWGDNYYGQLGDGSSDSSSDAPVQVSGLAKITAITTGDFHTLALKSDGTVWAWGRNNFSQLGDYSSWPTRTMPVQVVGPKASGFLAEVAAIAGGGSHTVALKSDGTVWTWGSNGNGQLGDGTTADSATPVQVIVLTGVVSSARAADIHTLPWRE